ncbi:MAG: hypothetical protein IKQ31_02565 [Clostridia bacterium]|nr:hypothetical protein [Clostridia bacterium]
MSKKEKRIFSAFLAIIALFLLISPYFILPRVYEGSENWIHTAPPNSTILELWEVDTFEGGSASRAKFLERKAYSYQKETLSTYILVRSLSLSQVSIMLRQGEKPDLVSFGVGAGEVLLPFCKAFSAVPAIRSDLLLCGLFEGAQFAVPWCVGGYCLCMDSDLGEIDEDNLISLEEKSEKELIGTGMGYNVSTYALNDSLKKRVSKTSYTQYEAYEEYLSRNSFLVLLGTQRDFYRLNNKVDRGVLGPIKYSYLDGYTDLEQCFSVCCDGEAKTKAEGFINFVCSETNQATLVDIGMFSVLDKPIYSNIYQSFESSILKTKKTLNIFTPNVNLKQMQGRENV